MGSHCNVSLSASLRQVERATRRQERGETAICDEAGCYVFGEAGCHYTRGRFSRTYEGRFSPKIGAGCHLTLFCQKHNRLHTHSFTAWLSSDAFSRACKETVYQEKARDGTRTRDSLLGRQELYQLSYSRRDNYERYSTYRGARTRTADLMVPNHARYQLRYTPLPGRL